MSCKHSALLFIVEVVICCRGICIFEVSNAHGLLAISRKKKQDSIESECTTPLLLIHIQRKKGTNSRKFVVESQSSAVVENFYN